VRLLQKDVVENQAAAEWPSFERCWLTAINIRGGAQRAAEVAGGRKGGVGGSGSSSGLSPSCWTPKGLRSAGSGCRVVWSCAGVVMAAPPSRGLLMGSKASLSSFYLTVDGVTVCDGAVSDCRSAPLLFPKPRIN